MIWKFLKTNWFTVGLVIIIIVAVMRKSGQFHTAPAEPARATREKFTDGNVLAQGPSRAEILSEGVLTPSHPMPAIEKSAAIAYLRRFGNVCKAEGEKFGVPASVLLAVSYVNSHSGSRHAAVEGNNFFALPCTSSWQGEKLEGDKCYRRYETAWMSFRDFSTFLSNRPWFSEVQQSCGTDWALWVKALAERGVSDVTYAEAEMTTVIKAYRLFELD